MKTLKDFTPEIKAKIPEYINKYTKGVFDGGRYNSFSAKDAEELIHWNYAKCGYKLPVVLVAENPYEMQLIFNFLVASKEVFLIPLYLVYCLKNKIEIPQEINSQLDSQLDSQLGSKLHSQLHSQLYSQLRSQLGSQLHSQLYSQLGSQLGSKLHSQLYSQLGSQLRSQLYSQLDSQLDSQLRSQLYSQLGSQLYSQLYSQLDSQLDSQLGSQLYSQLYSQLDSQLDSQLRSQLGSQLYSQLGSQLGSKLHSQLYSQLGSQLYSYNEMYLFTTNIYSNGLLAWWKFIKDEFIIETQIGVELDSWNDLYLRSGIYSAIFSELICVVSKYPKNIHRNENKDLHNTSGCAVEWGKSTDYTNFDCYYINGRSIPKRVFDKCLNGEVKKEDFIKEKNSEIQGAIYEILGQEKLMNLLGAKEIDKAIFYHKNGDAEEVVLYKTIEVFKELSNAPLAWVRFVCPSTGTNYLIDVEPSWNTAKEAAISTSPLFINEEDYCFTDRT